MKDRNLGTVYRLIVNFHTSLKAYKIKAIYLSSRNIEHFMELKR